MMDVWWEFTKWVAGIQRQLDHRMRGEEVILAPSWRNVLITLSNRPGKFSQTAGNIEIRPFLHWLGHNMSIFSEEL
jgi:hypothetical protein